jgi:hypothetical protein
LGGLLALAGYARAQSRPHPITPSEVMERKEYAGALRPVLLPPPPPGTAWTESVVITALKWLADHQEENGSWSVTGHVNRCIGPEACLPNPGTDAYTLAVTGLSLLAFQGAGYSSLAKDELPRIGPNAKVHLLYPGNVVRDGLGFLLSQQDGSGWIGSMKYRRHLLNHLFATQAVEGIRDDKSGKYKAPAGGRQARSGSELSGGGGDWTGCRTPSARRGWCSRTSARGGHGNSGRL